MRGKNTPCRSCESKEVVQGSILGDTPKDNHIKAQWRVSSDRQADMWQDLGTLENGLSGESGKTQVSWFQRKVKVTSEGPAGDGVVVSSRKVKGRNPNNSSKTEHSRLALSLWRLEERMQILLWGPRWDVDSGERNRFLEFYSRMYPGQERSLSQSLQFRGMCVSQAYTHTITHSCLCHLIYISYRWYITTAALNICSHD